MRSSRVSKILADVSSNRLRSGLAIVSLAIGTTAVGAMALGAITLDASFEDSLLAANPASAVLATGPFDEQLLGEVAGHPAVAEAEGRRFHRTQATGPDGSAVGIELVGMPDLADHEIARIAPEEGTWPPGPGEIVLERASIGELGAAVDERLAVEIPGREPLSLQVSGTAFDVAEIAPMLGGAVRGYVTMETMAELTGSDHLDALYLRAATDPHDGDRATAMTAAVRDDVLGPAGVTVAGNLIRDPGTHPAGSTMTFIVRAMQVLSVFALVIALGLVLTTVTALLAQQRKQLGMMKAVGATTRQLTFQYLASVGLLSLVALAVAIPASLLGGRAVAGAVAWLANIEPVPVGVPLRIILLEVGTAVVLPVAMVVVVVRRACAATVRETLTDRGLTASTRVRRSVSRLSRPTLLAVRNALGNRVRLGLTVLTVALCGAVLVGVSSTGGSLFRLADEVAGYTGYDVEIALTGPVPLTQARAVLDAPEVASVEGWWHKDGFLLRADGTEHDGISITGAPRDTSTLEATLLEGRWFVAEDRRPVVVNADLVAEEPALEVGDDVVLAVDGHRSPFTIVGISTSTTRGPVAYLPADDLATLLEEPGQANLLAVQLVDAADQAAVAGRLGDQARAAGWGVGEVRTNAEIRADLEGIITIAIALLLLVGAILAVVAVVGVAGTMTLGVFEQTREIGVLRTLGATTRTVRCLLLLQGLTVVGVGGVIGIALSLPVTWLLVGSIESTVLSPAELPTSFSWLAAAIWIPTALAIGAFGATQPARMAARLTVRDTLAYE